LRDNREFYSYFDRPAACCRHLKQKNVLKNIIDLKFYKLIPKILFTSKHEIDTQDQILSQANKPQNEDAILLWEEVNRIDYLLSILYSKPSKDDKADIAIILKSFVKSETWKSIPNEGTKDDVV
jgi:hypothetical protein